MQHLISFVHIYIPVNSMQTFPCMYPNIFFNISCTGLDLYLIQTIRPLKVHLCDTVGVFTPKDMQPYWLLDDMI
jgi:hypothetical protein